MHGMSNIAISPVGFPFKGSNFGSFSTKRFARAVASILFLLLLSATSSDALSDSQLAGLQFEQKLGAQISMELPFRDESGATIRLGDYFGQKPVIVVLGYYECPMLCTLVINGMVESLQDMKWSIGKEFEVINVSINPRETPELASSKKRSYLRSYGRHGAANGWHFLTGDETSIKRLADEVGFQYAYDSESRQYAHPSGLIILTPQGKIARYFFGVAFPPNQVYHALSEASSNKTGSPIERLVLLCFHYNPVTGKYSATILDVMRWLSAATLLGLSWLFWAMAKSNRRRKQPQPAWAATPMIEQRPGEKPAEGPGGSLPLASP